MFRFAYSKEFLRWALPVCPPAWLGWATPSGTAQLLWQTRCPAGAAQGAAAVAELQTAPNAATTRAAAGVPG